MELYLGQGGSNGSNGVKQLNNSYPGGGGGGGGAATFIVFDIPVEIKILIDIVENEPIYEHYNVQFVLCNGGKGGNGNSGTSVNGGDGGEGGNQSDTYGSPGTNGRNLTGVGGGSGSGSSSGSISGGAGGGGGDGFPLDNFDLNNALILTNATADETNNAFVLSGVSNMFPNSIDGFIQIRYLEGLPEPEEPEEP